MGAALNSIDNDEEALLDKSVVRRRTMPARKRA